jgi:dipeptidase E
MYDVAQSIKTYLAGEHKMKSLFLASYFKDVANLFPAFTNNTHLGKKVVFIPTASLTEILPFYVGTDKKALKKLGLIVDELEISKAPKDEIINKIAESDYIFVSGGNTFYLLQELKRTGTDKLIIDHINKGKTYIGSSAGSAITSKSIDYMKLMDNPRPAKELHDYSALSIVDFYLLPHFLNFPFIRITKKTVAEYSDKLDLRPINNNQAIIVNGDRVETLFYSNSH